MTEGESGTHHRTENSRDIEMTAETDEEKRAEAEREEDEAETEADQTEKTVVN